MKEPRTLEMIHKRFFKKYDTAKKYMENLVRRELIPPPMHVLWDEDDGGRPRNVYCRRDIPHKMRKHEICSCHVADAFRAHGVEVRVGKLPLFCDRYMELNGIPFHLEIDLGTENQWQLRNVLSKYHGAKGFVLFTTTTRDRLQLAMSLAGELKENAFFALIADVIREPFGKVWIDVTKKAVSLPKPSPKTPSRNLGQGETR